MTHTQIVTALRAIQRGEVISHNYLDTLRHLQFLTHGVPHVTRQGEAIIAVANERDDAARTLELETLRVEYWKADSLEWAAIEAHKEQCSATDRTEETMRAASNAVEAAGERVAVALSRLREAGAEP